VIGIPKDSQFCLKKIQEICLQAAYPDGNHTQTTNNSECADPSNAVFDCE
jgi:hypothetical protein